MAYLTVGVLDACIRGLPDDTIVCAADQDGNPVAWDDSDAERGAASPMRSVQWLGKFGLGNVLTLGGSAEEYDSLVVLDEVRKFCEKNKEDE